MSDSQANANEPSDTPVPANECDWRLAARITDDPAAGDVNIKAVSRRQFDSGEDFAVEVLLDDRVIAVFRHAGTWYAIDGMCSHQGGPLADGVVRDGCVTCPWHGWQYDLATGIQLINHQPLQESFPIRQVDDRIEIQLSTDGPSR